MKSVKRAFLQVKRQNSKHGLLLIFVLVLGTFLSGALSVRHAIQATEEMILLQVPAVATISLDMANANAYHDLAGLDRSLLYHNRPTTHQLSSIGNLPYVRAYDYYISAPLFSFEYEWSVIDVDITQVRAMDENSVNFTINHFASLGRPYAMFPVMGVSNPNITDIQSGLIRLVDGRVFNEDEINDGNLVAVVSNDFVEINNLKIGDYFELQSLVGNLAKMHGEGVFDWSHRFDEEFLVHQEIIKFQIIGTFERDIQIDYLNQDEKDFSSYLSIHADLNNQIYVPVTIVDQIVRRRNTAELEIIADLRSFFGNQEFLHAEAEPVIDSIFLLYNPRDLSRFIEKANELLPEFWEMRDVSGAFYPIIASMDSVLEIADTILWLAIGSSVVILTLVITFLVNDRRREIGTYMALGAKISDILVQFMTEIFLVVGVGIVLSLFTGNILSEQISRIMFRETLIEQSEVQTLATQIPWQLALFNPNTLPIDEVLDIYDTSLDLQTISMFVGINFIVILIATIVPIAHILKTNPKDVLVE